MRRLIMLCALVWLVALVGCTPSFSWEVTGTWRIRPLDPSWDSANMEQIGISRDQIHRYRAVLYDFRITNKGRKRAEWVGVFSNFHPDFQARIRNRFGLEDHPPLRLDPGGAGTVGATFILEGTDEELAALAKENRFYLSWEYKAQKMRMDVQASEAPK